MEKVIALLLLSGTAVFAEEPAQRSELYRTDAFHFGADLLAKPNATAKIIGVIPPETTLTPLAKESYFIKVKVDGKTGWASTVGMEHLMSTPAPNLQFSQDGYKIVDGKYRYFFGCSNEGVQPYTDTVKIHLYAGDKEITTREYPDTPGEVIAPSASRAFFIDSSGLATRYEVETKQGKREGKIGKHLQDPP
jgi:hypothetical protein